MYCIWTIMKHSSILLVYVSVVSTCSLWSVRLDLLYLCHCNHMANVIQYVSPEQELMGHFPSLLTAGQLPSLIINNKFDFDTDPGRNIHHSKCIDVSAHDSFLTPVSGVLMRLFLFYVCTGQLGNPWGNTQRRLAPRPGAREAGELHVEEEEVAIEGLA